jgi:hypothetical protein
MELTREIGAALSAPFGDDEMEARAGATTGDKRSAMVLWYIDARAVMRRLDHIVGPEGWSFDYDVLTPDCKKVKGRLTVLGVTKCDAGEAAAEEEPLKSAVSDALKRAAVHFGVGRFLYDLPAQWAEYDAQKRRFVEKPRVPHARQEQAPPKPRTQGEVQERVRGVLESIPTPGPAPIVGGNGEAARLRARLAAVCAEASINDADSARAVCAVVLNKAVPRISELIPDELERVISYVEDNPRGAAAIVATADETLPLEVAGSVPAGLQQS